MHMYVVSTEIVPCEHVYTSVLVCNQYMCTSSYNSRDISMSDLDSVVHSWVVVHSCLTVYAHCKICPFHWIPLET